MSQNQRSASAILRTLFLVTIGLGWIGADPALAQNQVSSGELTPPPPTAADTSAATTASDVIDRDASKDLGYRELLQGPVHEAFASHADSGSIVNPRVYPEKPPADVREQPPEARPDGDKLLWIPGYWSWDDHVAKYVWVSGVYRKMPPGRTWVAGYWSDHGGGYRWTSGYWSSTRAGVDDQVYLPAPPQSIDNGPSVPPPGDDYFWLPGSWEHNDGVYRWRSGYWTRHYEGWVWQPACYITTPQGCIYNTGYWDVLPPDRGMLYSPIDFYRPVYLNPGFVYRPRFPLASASSAALLLNLFARRGHPGFFYGDFYGPSYAALGYRPWFDQGDGYGGFGYGAVPWLAYYDWNYGRRGTDFRGSMGRYKSFYDKAGRGGGSSMKFDANIARFAEKPNPGRGSSEKAARRSLDDVVLRDFDGQSPPRVDRGTHGKFLKHDSNLNPAKTKSDFDAQRGLNPNFAPPNPNHSNPNHSNPKHSSPGVMVENQGKKSQGNPSSPQTFDRGSAKKSFDRGPAQPSVQRGPPAQRGSDSFGGTGKGGKSDGGGNRGRGGGGKGNSGKGGGKK